MVLVALAALPLTACDFPTTPDTSKTSEQSSSVSLIPAPEGRTHYPLQIKTASGQTTLQARPTRIAVAGQGSDIELLAALKVTPVLAPAGVTDRAQWVAQELPGEIERTFDGGADDFPVGEVADSHPDLVVATEGDLLYDYDQIKKIAPVLLPAAGQGKVAPTWRERMMQLGEVLDLRSAAAAAIKKHDDRLAALRAQYPQFAGKTVTYADLYAAEFGPAHGSMPGSGAERLFTALGFSPNPLAKKVPSDATITDDKLGLLDADAVVMCVDDAVKGRVDELLTGKPGYRRLSAVKNNHVALVYQSGDVPFRYTHAGQEHPGHLTQALSFPGPLADVWAADQLAPILGGLIH